MNEGKSDRQQRLAEALRANLRRRKGQARERADGGQHAAEAAEGSSETGKADEQPLS